MINLGEILVKELLFHCQNSWFRALNTNEQQIIAKQLSLSIPVLSQIAKGRLIKIL